MAERELEIVGHRDERVPNRFIQQEGADRLAILLPGYGYTCDMPLFYYAENLLADRGFDVLRVEYAYNRRDDFGDARSEAARAWLRDDAVAACRAGLVAGAYRELALVGKSLGTMAMGEALDDLAGGTPLRAVWLTPLLFDDRLAEQIARWAPPSLFVAGGNDPAHVRDRLEAAVRATDGRAVVVDGVDHGLDIPGDPVSSAEELTQVVRAMAAFLDAA